jgi:hypothetical protein
MKQTPPALLPRRRLAGLVIQEMPDEILVYDKTTDQAHCLNHAAAFVWRACNGQQQPREIARELTIQLDAAVSENFVLLALAELEKVNLLEQQGSELTFSARQSRRQMVRTLGLAATIVLPLVSSITVPTPAQAATCTPSGQPCSPVKLCCTSCNPAAPGGPKCI